MYIIYIIDIYKKGKKRESIISMFQFALNLFFFTYFYVGMTAYFFCKFYFFKTALVFLRLLKMFNRQRVKSDLCTSFFFVMIQHSKHHQKKRLDGKLSNKREIY